MRYLILLCTLVIAASPAHAAKQDKNAATIAAVNALTQYCLPPVNGRKDPIAFAVSKGLIEFAPEQALKFAPDGGRVFAIPSALGNAVLITNPNFGDMCSIAVREIRVATFWETLDQNLKGFSLMREKRVEEDRLTRKEYALETLGGPITLLASGSDVPRPNGMQALMTLARVRK